MPVALTAKLALLPWVTVRLPDQAVMTGRVPTLRIALLLVSPPAALLA